MNHMQLVESRHSRVTFLCIVLIIMKFYYWNFIYFSVNGAFSEFYITQEI